MIPSFGKARIPTRRKRAALAFLAFAVGALLAPGAGAITGFSLLTPERLWDLARIDDPQVSPDGRYVVFTVTGFPRGTDLPSIDLWIASADGKGEPRQLTRNPGPDVDPAWSPDSASIVYASSRPGETSTDIYILNLRGGEPEPLTRFPTDARKPRFRGDGQSVVFEAETFADVDADLEALALRVASMARAQGAATATEARLARRNGRALDPRLVIHLFEVPVNGGLPRDLTPGFTRTIPLAPFEWDLSGDGRYATLTGVVDDPPYRSLDRDVYLVDLEDGGFVNLTADRAGSAFGPRFDRRGGLLYGEHTRRDALAENTRLIRHDLARGETVLLNQPELHSPEEWVMDPAGGQVYFLAEERGARHAFRVGANGGKARQVVAGGDVRNLRIGSDGDLYFLRGSLQQPPELRRTDANGNHARVLTSLNAPLLEDTRMGSAQRMSFPGYGGREVEAHVVLPPGFDPGRRWPVLLLLHGGPHQAWLDGFYQRWNLMAFASPGYVVVAPNLHGSTGYGQAFGDAVVGDPLAPAAADVRAISDGLAQLSWIDPDRLALVGGSYGGYLANWIVTHDDRYRTAVVHAGVFDLMVQFGSDFPWGRDRTYGALPWEDPDRYRALSPSSRAAVIQTPMLLLHGELDHRVPTVQSLMLHNVLTARGVPTRLALFPIDGHQIDRRSAALRWWREVFDWLRRHSPPGPRTAS